MKKMSIDLETRGGADLRKTGVYRYAEDPDFDILLFGVSVDDGRGAIQPCHRKMGLQRRL